MSKFIQLHILASYPPSNLNRDDLGRPKTAVMGGTQRLRISSQSLKRAWRTSDIFQQKLEGHFGIRTKEMGVKIKDALMSGSSLKDILTGKTKLQAQPQVLVLVQAQAQAIIPEKDAKLWAWKIGAVFVDKPTTKAGKTEEKDTVDTEEKAAEDADGKGKSSKKEMKTNIDKETLKGEQLVFYSDTEVAAIQDLINVISKEKREPNNAELSTLLHKNHSCVDIAMFGRMLTNASKYNIEAAVQVAHAITVHEVAVEDDYFTAVDDLNQGTENAGAAHLGETEFASGLFYTYVCIDVGLLQKNLGDQGALTQTAISALVETVAKVAPSGKQNSFASRAYASYLLAEKGPEQPRSLSVAYLAALRVKDEKDLLSGAIKSLNDTRAKMDAVYGKCCDEMYEMNARAGTGTMKDILEFVSK